MSRLYADNVTLAYGPTAVVARDLSMRISDGKVTAIVGPNGCGKSTLLRALARLLLPQRGAVVLDGEAIHRQPTKAVAKRIGLLPQQPDAPEAITVEDLARRGRYPHQGFLQPPSKDDERAVQQALELTDMVALRECPVDELSGGQRQRAWIAMALAQETPLVLLDEPTTYLDINHQQEILAPPRSATWWWRCARGASSPRDRPKRC
jgi:iron complex transport system ATP-binding protein